MDLDSFKAKFINKYKGCGHLAFYNYLLVYCSKKIVLIESYEFKGTYPHIEMLNFYNFSMQLYRRDGDEILFIIAKLFRKVGHKIYRIMLKRKLVVESNLFLTKVG